MFFADNEKMDSSPWWGHVLCPVLFHVLGSGSVRAIANFSRNLQSRGKFARTATSFVGVRGKLGFRMIRRYRIEMLKKRNETYQ